MDYATGTCCSSVISLKLFTEYLTWKIPEKRTTTISNRGEALNSLKTIPLGSGSRGCGQIALKELLLLVAKSWNV